MQNFGILNTYLWIVLENIEKYPIIALFSLFSSLPPFSPSHLDLQLHSIEHRFWFTREPFSAAITTIAAGLPPFTVNWANLFLLLSWKYRGLLGVALFLRLLYIISHYLKNLRPHFCVYAYYYHFYSIWAAEEEKIESSSFLVCVLRGVQKSHDFEFELVCKLNPFLYGTESPMYFFLALGLPQDTLFRT